MITIHWSIIVFIIIEAPILAYFIKSLIEGDGHPITNFFRLVILIVIIAIALIWGGIFWW